MLKLILFGIGILSIASTSYAGKYNITTNQCKTYGCEVFDDHSGDSFLNGSTTQSSCTASGGRWFCMEQSKIDVMDYPDVTNRLSKLSSMDLNIQAWLGKLGSTVNKRINDLEAQMVTAIGTLPNQLLTQTAKDEIKTSIMSDIDTLLNELKDQIKQEIIQDLSDSTGVN